MSRLPFPKKACVHYLAESRWPDGYACPRCDYLEAYELSSRPVYKCKKCNYQVSVTAGTVLHGTRLPLRDWFSAAYLVATHASRMPLRKHDKPCFTREEPLVLQSLT